MKRIRDSICRSRRIDRIGRVGINFGAFAACCVLAACAKSPAYFIAEGAVGASEHGSVLLLPLNVDGQIPHYVADSTDLLEETLVAYLDQHQKQVKRISFSAVRAHWKTAIGDAVQQRGESAASAETLPVARQLLAKALAAQEGTDAVIFQSIVERAARYKGSAAKWDSMKRKQIIDWNGPKSWGDTTQTLTGQTPALSLQIGVYSSAGDEVFSRYAGLELTEKVTVIDFKYSMSRRTDLLTDSEILQESVELAFDPYLTRPVE